MSLYRLLDSSLEKQVNFMEAILLKLLKLINGLNLLILNFNHILVQSTTLFMDLPLQPKRNMMKPRKAYLKS
jgi:hypothetical protein